ncbi:biotin transporter BioY [Acetivibrio mesophilus]|uniref:Biotin transporter n=1 Tax=Acetivibrio mesophilus TaxID=2487273 RepID=A0A4Q0I4A5_9FIRM|nr:biotin transporter BioY [Acetivibrio mesophilus]ODM26103.1 biotin biosynthesis protein BioY [Clostridium sp. Bc-iso-3]RXE59071.1 biotin transporter BioY [Acetivibrio mesophilus]HHV28309.1 biotin transporter BioY [Clostridium sp.]
MTGNKYLRDMMYAAIFTGLMAVLGWISITLPILPAPITGQTIGVMLAGAILTPRQAGLSMATYIALGAVGLPVFQKGGAGLAYLTGPTGGFIIGFLAGAIVISLLKGNGKNGFRIGLACIVGGILVVYAIGIPWLCFKKTASLFSWSLAVSNLAFIPGDVIKVCIASIIGVRVNKSLEYQISACNS